jgi:hypothetical protein
MMIERGSRVAGICLDYDEFTQMVSSGGESVKDAAARFRREGVFGLMVREQTLDDLERSGEAVAMTAADLSFQQTLNPDFCADIVPRQNRTYLFIRDASVFDRVRRNLTVKAGSHVQTEPSSDQGGILSAVLSSRQQASIGLGFPVEIMNQAAEGGLQMVVRIRVFAPVNDASLTVLRKNLEETPSLVLGGFNDESLPGYESPEEMQALGDVFKAVNLPLASFEFYAQRGLETLSNVLDKNVIRVHSINENEMRRYNIDSAVARYALAAAERNIRVLYVRLFEMDQPASAARLNQGFIQGLNEALIREGFQIGTPVSMGTLDSNIGRRRVVGLGIIAAGLWLLYLIRPAASNRLAPVLGALGLLGAIAWIGLLRWAPSLGCKGFAFLSVVIFPTLGMMLFLKETPRDLGRSVLALLGISWMSFMGAILMTGLLTEKSYMLALDGFKGVKLAHVVPLALTPAILWAQKPHPIQRVRAVLTYPLRVWQLAAAALALAALAVYIMRTGNTGTIQVSALEELLRQTLDYVLGVRPRTKEFALGHPLMLLLLYYGYSDRKIPLLLFAAIGQISLANTYAHIHTPLSVSFLRTFNGMWMGVAVGLAAIGLVNVCLRLSRAQRESREAGS